MAYFGDGLDEVVATCIAKYGDLARNMEEDIRDAWEDGHRDYCIDARYGHDPRHPATFDQYGD